MPILPVPYVGQWGANANRYGPDCGVACVAMLLEYYGKRGDWTVDRLAAQTPLATGAGGLHPYQLPPLAQLHGLPLIAHGTNLQEIRYQIDARRPVIALIAYRFILGRLDQGDNQPGSDGHFVVVVGYDDSHFVLNDPDFWYPYAERGHDYLCPVTELDRAMVTYGNWGVFVEENKLSNNDLIIAKATQAKGLEDDIIALAGTPTPPALPPVPGDIMYCTSKNGLNVRSAPNISGTIVGGIPYAFQVKVVDAVVNGSIVTGWKQITDYVDASYIGKYASAGFLSTTRPTLR